VVDQLLNDILKASDDEDKETLTFEIEDTKLEPLMEEIDLIQDQYIRGFVRAILVQASFFWEAPAATIPMIHPPDEYGSGGLVLHTRRVCRSVWLLAICQRRTMEEVDILLAAALLHDVTKVIASPEGEVAVDYMHPYTVDHFIRQVGLNDEKKADVLERSTTLFLQNDPECVAQILRLIRCHEGAHSPIPETIPLTSLEWIMHLGNQVACQLHTLVDGPDPNSARWAVPPPMVSNE
jgi:hypothetical protein